MGSEMEKLKKEYQKKLMSLEGAKARFSNLLEKEQRLEIELNQDRDRHEAIREIHNGNLLKFAGDNLTLKEYEMSKTTLKTASEKLAEQESILNAIHDVIKNLQSDIKAMEKDAVNQKHAVFKHEAAELTEVLQTQSTSIIKRLWTLKSLTDVGFLVIGGRRYEIFLQDIFPAPAENENQSLMQEIENNLMEV